MGFRGGLLGPHCGWGLGLGLKVRPPAHDGLGFGPMSGPNGGLCGSLRTSTRHQYRIDSTECSPFLRDPLFPVTRSLTLSPHRTVDPPSHRLLDVHRAIALIMKLTALANILTGSFVIWRSWMSEKIDRHIWDIL
jgi:hypothetical protein